MNAIHYFKTVFKATPNWLGVMVLTTFLVAAGSCNKAVENHLSPAGDYGADTSEVVIKQKKVLYVIIDGLRGEAIRTYMPTHLNRIARQSVYTFNSLNNASGINAVTWSDMLTGVDTSKHQVKTADFTGNNLSNYPSIVTRLTQTAPEHTTASFVRSSELDQQLLKDAADRNVLGSDQAVVTAAKAAIASADNSLFIVELAAVDSTGQASGYDDTNADYHNAVIEADNAVGELVTAVAGRENYLQEDWLIVVASNGGGPISMAPDADRSYYNNPNGNGFVYFYNPRFSLDFHAKPGVVNYQGSTPIYYNTSFYARVDDNTAYDIKPNTEMTISFKMKILALANNTFNPGILKKTNSSANSNVGWWFIHNNNTGAVRFVLHGTSGGNKTLNNMEAPANIGEWHSYTGKVYFDGGRRYMKMYVDGLPVQMAPIDVTGIDCTSPTAFDVGQRGSYVSGTTREMITDIEIYSVALPDEVIAERACKPEVKPTDPYYEYLIGYWPCTDGNGEQLKDLSPSGNHLNMVNVPASTWNGFNDASNNICPDVSEDYLTATPKGLDIPYEILQWLGVRVEPGWGLDGRAWPTGYNNLKEN